MTSRQPLQGPRYFQSFTTPSVSCATDIHLANTIDTCSGILNTGLFIAIARSTIVESFEQSYRRRRHLMRARRRLHQQQTARIKRGSRNTVARTVAVTQAGTGITGTAVMSDPSDGKAGAEREAANYMKFREEMAAEEKKEFRAKLCVSCGLFTSFWLIGSAIFMATEGWSYGLAIYFCRFPVAFLHS